MRTFTKSLATLCVAGIIGLLALAPCRGSGKDDKGIAGSTSSPSAPVPGEADLGPPQLKIDDSRWMNNKLGMDHDVPPPWTPLTRVGNVIGCWDRSYRFDGAFPTAIRGREKDLLSAPVRLVATIGRKKYVLSNNQVTFTTQRDDHIDFTATGELGPLKLTSHNWIEFDGMVQIKFDLEAGSGAKVESMDLEIPIPASVAKYYFFCDGNWGGRPLGAIGTQPGWRFGTQFWPLCWVGDDYRGLSFVAEEGHFWTSPPHGQYHELLRTTEGFVWKVHIIGRPTHMSKANHYLIGLQGTPMKPMRKDMAAFNPFMGVWSALPSYYGGSHPNTWPDLLQCTYPDTEKGVAEMKEMGINSVNMFEWSTRWKCYPEYRAPERTKKAIALWHKAGLSVTQYWSSYFFNYQSDVYQRHAKEWAHMTTDGKLWLPLSGGNSTCCPRSSFGDFMVWGADQLMRTYDLDGLGFVDGPGPLYCANPLHGCQGGTTAVFRDREVFKRWYKIIKKYKPNGYLWAHVSENFGSPIMAFMDAYIGGEEFRTVVHPLKDLDRTRLAVTMTGYQWGSQPMWMYQCTANLQENTEWVSARVLPYGAIVMVDWTDPSVIVPVQKAKLKFGVGDQGTTFYAPHELPAWLKMNREDFVTGCWKRADGEVLLIISNFDEKYKNAKINGAPFEKNGRFAVARDATTDARYISTNNTFNICVPGNSFRVVWINPASDELKPWPIK
jgi:hypothetical protein